MHRKLLFNMHKDSGIKVQNNLGSYCVRACCFFSVLCLLYVLNCLNEIKHVLL